LRIIKQQKAISTLILVLLILASLVIGAFLSYLWVMADFYNMPQDSTLLVVENVDFSPSNFAYFNVTVLNPSNSVLDANITGFSIYLEESNQTYTIESAEPDLSPFSLKKGTRQTFKCFKNWSAFAGETVKVEPIAENASTKSSPYTTPKTKLIITPNFNASLTVENFTITLNSTGSNVNLTISQLKMFTETLNVEPSLPQALAANSAWALTCKYNWESRRGQNVTISLKTVEGYETSITFGTVPLAYLYIDEVAFDYDDTSYFNFTIKNYEYSDTNATVNRANITTFNETITLFQTTPALNETPTVISPNTTLLIKCQWSWSAYRNSVLTVQAFTKEGFTISNMTVTTPPVNVWNITDVSFDLHDTGNFSIRLVSRFCSVNNTSIIAVQLNDLNVTLFSPAVEILRDSEATLNCTYDWKSLRGSNATITVIASDGTKISRTTSIPSAVLELLGDALVYGNLTDANMTIPYVNITILNSANSTRSLVISKIIMETGNRTYEIDNTLTQPKLTPNGYTLAIGQNVTFTCLWDYSVAGANPVKVIVYTSEGIQTSKTWPKA